MTLLRAFLRDHRKLASLVLAMALLMKALVPAGYMVESGSRVLAVAICADASGGHFTLQIVIPGKTDGEARHDKAEGTCAFSALAMGALGGADPALLLIALAFILLLGLAPAPARRKGPARLRPPLRGPPVPA
ncbi:hypothetical protein H7F51_14955 [Novosphingobium flavum]|uniref:DUF2946 domain-containing protein n=1 Tax=Novosphingobium flavum TaxID=1778672 RepID=A0A7X1FTQ3_9SPHN|nr:hypothetical protein [Novosphingobium flavum]MBC2666815.1 hypothetical protein [Novosphingobium flavum]